MFFIFKSKHGNVFCKHYLPANHDNTKAVFYFLFGHWKSNKKAPPVP